MATKRKVRVQEPHPLIVQDCTFIQEAPTVALSALAQAAQRNADALSWNAQVLLEIARKSRLTAPFLNIDQHRGTIDTPDSMRQFR